MRFHGPSPVTSTPASIPGTRPRCLPPSELAYVLEGYRSSLPVSPRIEAHLHGVVRDALDHPGSLVRAQLAFAVLRAHGEPPETARALAVAIEYFHTASLIFDDMPNMDDAAERRGRPCPHRVHGEAAATLGALALITRAYALLWQVLAGLPEESRRRAGALVESCLGVEGILNGQSLDLHFGSGRGVRQGAEKRVEQGANEVLRVAQGKTVSLIRLTLLLPAIVAGVGDEILTRLERLSLVWGLSYQILDDFKDELMSRDETGKSTRRDGPLGRPNLPAEIGDGPALERLSALLEGGREILAAFDGDARWNQLEPIQDVLEQELQEVVPRIPLAASA